MPATPRPDGRPDTAARHPSPDPEDLLEAPVTTTTAVHKAGPEHHDGVMSVLAPGPVAGCPIPEGSQ